MRRKPEDGTRVMFMHANEQKEVLCVFGGLSLVSNAIDIDEDGLEETDLLVIATLMW